ncbi:MAG: GNAT family N-acetyltransferase [Candidatus Diapherotrites archaeon]
MSNELIIKKIEFTKIPKGNGLFYWTWEDYCFMPYGWIEEKQLKELPVPFLLLDIHPDCLIGFESDEKDGITNIIELPEKFGLLKIDSDLRKDLKRIEKKNAEIRIEFNEKDALDKSKQWFQELWHEEEEDFSRRLIVWKKKAYTLSAYSGNELIGVHVAIEGKETIYYLGCWWNRKYKSQSIPIFMIKKDIEKAIESKKKYYDLGVGDEPYKKDWNVIEKPTKYYAILTKELAEKTGIKKFIEIKEK